MMWKGFEPIVYHLTGTYKKGINVAPETLVEFLVDWHLSEDPPTWAITIHPT